MFKNKFVIAILILVFLPWFLPGFRVATDFPLTSRQAAVEVLTVPQSWTNRFGNGLGEYSVGTLWAWPMELVYGAGAKIGLGLGAIERLAGLLPALVLGYLGLALLAGPVGGLVYLVNSYFLLLVDGGQLGLALAYGLLPLCIYLYLRVLEKPRLFSILKFVLAVIFLSISDLRIIYFLILVITAHFLFGILILKRRDFLIHLKLALVTGIFLLGLHSYWLLPAVASKAPSLPQGYTSVSGLNLLSFANLNHALLLAQPHWPQNIFGHISAAKAEFAILPILAFAVFFLSSKDRKLTFWGWLALGAIFLSKGSNPPAGAVYSWLFTHVPGFFLFRDPVKFFFLVALAYAYLTGIFFRRIKALPSYMAASLLAVYLVVMIWPIYSHKTTGTFSTPRFAHDFEKLNSHLAQDQSFGRVLWVPTRPPLGTGTPNHPVVEGLQLANNRSFAAGNFGTYETLGFLRDASASGKLMQIAGIKYVVYPPLDPLRDTQKPEDIKYHANFLTQLSQTSWAGTSEQFGQVPLLTTNRPVDLFFIPKEIKFVVGSDAIYNTTPDLTKTSLVFAEGRSDLLSQMNNYPSASLTLFGKTSLDAAAALIGSKQLIFPSLNLANSPNDSGWWKRGSNEFLWLRSWLQEKYGVDNQDFDYQAGYAISEGEHQLDVSLGAFPENSVLLARVLKNARGGKISFFQAENLVGAVDTLSKDNAKSVITVKGLGEIADRTMEFSASEFLWTEVGPIIDSSSTLSIRTEGDLNIVNSLAVVPVSQWNELKQKSVQLQQRQPHGNQGAQVNYQKISPTHYKIRIQGLTEPGMLVFSQNYDSLWQLDGQSPVLVYSFLAGFPISQNKEYDLVYTPQKFVGPGLAVSGIFLVSFLGLVVYTKLCQKD